MRLRSFYFLLASSIVIPVSVFCGVALSMLQEAQNDSAIGRIEASASLTARMIDADIYRAQSVLKVLAGSHALSQGDLARFYAEAREASAGPGAWIILYDTTGQQLVNTRLEHGVELPRRGDPETVARLIAAGKGHVSGIKWGSALKNNFVIVEIPLVTESGQRYVLGQAFSPRFFAHNFAAGQLPPNWRVSLLDQNGIIIARSAQADQFVGKRVSDQTFSMIRKQRTGVFKHVNGAGVEMYDAFTRSALSNWSIIYGAPVAEIDAAVRRGVTIMGIGLFIAMMSALALTMFAGRHLVRYVSRASESAGLLGRGGEVSTLPRSAIFELERLNEAILEASRRLQAEMRSRSDAERERNELFVLEKRARTTAEEQNAAKDEFLAMLGHELRNPLSAIASAVSILDSGLPLDAAVTERARDVLRRQTGHLRKLVDDLLEVNRALMGKLVLQTEPVDLAEVVQRCIDTLQASGRAGGLDLRVESVPALVSADPTRLLQVIDNIFDNVIKYSPDGGVVQVTIRHDGGEVEFSVRDSGQGIAPDLLPSVFEVFVQGKQSLQRAHGGLGIGLSLVRRLVELHGGTVRIDSEGIGKGTTVTVRLPRLLDSSLPLAKPLTPMAVHMRRVLLIEDNADARDMMTMLLELRQCEVIGAATGSDGIALARTHQPSLAIIDIGLPGMDGYAVARALKSSPDTAGIELVALTGYGSESDRIAAIEAGFSRHFTKPIQLADLEAALA